MVSRPLCVRVAARFFVAESPPRRVDPIDMLLAEARAGDARAFEQVRDRFEPALVGFIRGYMKGDDDTAMDVVQETFVVAWMKLDQIRDARHLRPWLYRVARFKAISFLRRRGPGGKAWHSLEFAAEHGADVPDPAMVDPLRQALRRDAADPWRGAVRTAIDRLPRLYVAVIRLFYDRGLTTRQVAHLLRLPRTTVKMRLLRGRALLRTLILEEMGGREPDL